MTRLRWKVCCIASVDEARRAVAAGADAIGLVGPMPSGPGVIDDATIAAIAAATPAPAERWLLTSRTTADGLIDHVRTTGVDTVQIVDDTVSAATRHAVRRALGAVQIVQVVHVVDASSVAVARAAADGADVVLLDSGAPNAAVRELGGTGRVHDWSHSARIVEALDVPVILAGGLGAHNVAEAIRAVRPAGVDMCSSTRTDGRLDARKLAAVAEALGRGGAA